MKYILKVCSWLLKRNCKKHKKCEGCIFRNNSYQNCKARPYAKQKRRKKAK